MFRLSETIRRTQTNDGDVLLDIHNGRMFCLNAVGSRILELLRQRMHESCIADEISREYEEDRERVRADVAELLETLEQNGIILPVDASRPTEQAGHL